MEIDNRKILTAIVVITLLLFPIVAFTTGPLRIALGLSFVLFFPGYTLSSALFPKRDSLDVVERVALSFGLSIAVVPLIGLVLNYTPWGIRLYPILISVTLFIILTSATAYYRQHKIPEADRLHFAFGIRFPHWAGLPKLDKALSVSLLIAILAAIGCLGYVVTAPKQGEKFTEFYLLNVEGKAESYPSCAISDEPVELIIGVVNHESQATSYRVEIKIRGEIINQLTTGSLSNDQKWEEIIDFTPHTPGEKERVEFYLYRNEEVQPYFKDPLHLYLEVVPKLAQPTSCD
jgi:uncharacterized membrane protein